MKNTLNSIVLNRLITRHEFRLKLDQVLSYEYVGDQVVNKGANRRYSFYIPSSLIIMNNKL